MASNDVWVVAERNAQGLPACTLEAIDEGRRLVNSLKGQLVLILLGDDLSQVVSQASSWDVDCAYCLEHPLLAHYNTGNWVTALTEAWRIQTPAVTLFSATPNGQDAAPRLAARLGLNCYLDCVQVKLSPQGELRFIRPTHQEKVYTTYICPPGDCHYIASLRPGVIEAAPPAVLRHPQVTTCQPNLSAVEIGVKYLEFLPGDPTLVDLAIADRIVAGGKGVGSPEQWQLVEKLADALDASVGGSRMAVDAGWISRSRLIGQTGKSIHARLYIAAGISGVYQHLGGVQVEDLLAINIDRSAPIFARASLGTVGDLREVLPILIHKIEQHKAQQKHPIQPGGKD